jgi:hypothetical protein
LIGLAVSSTLYVRAFQVAPLPGGNLLANPWFRSYDNPNVSALDGWTDAAGTDRYWSTSQKESDPSPEIVVSGVCGNQSVYCGTSARLKDTPGSSGGVGVRGIDAHLYQVVSADSSNKKLKFFAHWVSHLIDPAEVVIYGGDNPVGPWTQVWVPFHVVVTELVHPPDGCGSTCLWEETGWLETVLPHGYSYYKIEIHARLPEEGTVGFKISGIYFSVVDANSSDPTPTLSSPTTTPPPVTPTPTTPPNTVTPTPERVNQNYLPILLNPLVRQQ